MTEISKNTPASIRKFIVETFLFGDDSGLSDQTSFMETGIIDSIGILKVADFIESTFGITLTQEQFVPENLDSIENIATFLHRNIAPQSVETAISPD
jgi:acyl carrier protein